MSFDETFWPRYPHKVGKPVAQKAFEKLHREMKGDIGPIMLGLDRYIAGKPSDRPWLNPATFLNGRRFEDEPLSASASPAKSSEQRVDFGGGVIWPESTVVACIARWRSDPSSWPSGTLGSEPDKPDCRVPKHLLREAA